MDKSLNPDQLEAVQYTKSPLLIIAGAGTGKTTVITEKIKYLISSGFANPEEILALTFTEKASFEMEERVDQILPLGYSQMWIMTFHSFCDRVLRAEGLNIGLDTNYALLTQTDSLTLLKRHLFDMNLKYYLPLGNPNRFLSALLNHFSRLADEDVSPDQYLDWAKSQSEEQHLEVAGAYDLYQKLKIKTNKLDFADLITYTLNLFRTRPGILAKYQSKFKYLLVDEFQDTNYSQNQLVNLLAAKNQNLTVVGDDDQAIYRFRGASLSNILQYKKIYSKAKIIVLSQNYRSSQEILDKSYRLISYNNPDRLEIAEKINKKLTAVNRNPGHSIEFIHTNTVDLEADAVSEKIQQLLNNQVTINKLTYQDFAILVRANAHAEPFLKSLSFHGLPVQFLGPAKLFSQPEVKDLIAFFKIMVDPADDISLYRLLAMPFFRINYKDLAFLTSQAKKNNQSLFSLLESQNEPRLIFLSALLNSHLLMVPDHTAGQILYSFLEKSEILKDLISGDGLYSSPQAENITRLFNKIKAFENQNEDSNTTTVLDWIQTSIEAGESPAAAEIDWSNNNAVNILTVHSSKGLEFPVVFLVNLVSLRFPSLNRSEEIPIPDIFIKETLPAGDFHLQEERRLFYVGLTRAREYLYLTSSDYYGDAKRPKKLSPFIFETLGDETLNQQTPLTSPIKLINISKNSPSNQVTNNQLTYLSYTQIQTFLDCPLHYKAKYILNLPSPPSAASSFGNIIHATLKDYFTKPSNILSLLNKNWLSYGFENQKHEAKYKNLGEKYLTDFVKSLPSKFIPSQNLEEPFIVPLISPDGKRKIKIGGKIDRIDYLPDGTIEIIDYKTSSKIPTQKEVDENLQLSFYALAARAFTKKPVQTKLSLYFFEGQQKISTTRTKSQLDEAITKIFDYASQIESSTFECSHDPYVCSRCDFQSLCDVK